MGNRGATFLYCQGKIGEGFFWPHPRCRARNGRFTVGTRKICVYSSKSDKRRLIRVAPARDITHEHARFFVQPIAVGFF